MNYKYEVFWWTSSEFDDPRIGTYSRWCDRRVYEGDSLGGAIVAVIKGKLKSIRCITLKVR